MQLIIDLIILIISIILAISIILIILMVLIILIILIRVESGNRVTLTLNVYKKSIFMELCIIYFSKCTYFPLPC